jgi:hypothetical protein
MFVCNAQLPVLTCTMPLASKRMLTSDFKEFAELLNLNQAEYLVVGGYALAAYGHPRYTGDLDFHLDVLTY